MFIQYTVIVIIVIKNGIGGSMKSKYVTIKVSYDTEETWEITMQEVKEIFQMMNNLKRNAIIIDIEQGVNENDDG